MYNSTYLYASEQKGPLSGVALIRVHSPSVGKGTVGSAGARAVNGKRGLLSCIGICRQVGVAAARG